MKKLILTALVFIAVVNLGFAQEPIPIPLYPNGVPNSKKAPAGYVEQTVKESVTKVTDPVLIPFFPEKGIANGTAVIIFPGGGYTRLAIGYEGYEVAREFNKIGVTAFVLKYRLPSDDIMQDKSIGPLQDAQEAILMVRTRAAEWGIDPARVGVAGFSAGGHLASTMETHFNKAVIVNKNNISLRPDFVILGYPVISFGDITHKGSRQALLGDNPTAEQVDLYSNEKQVTPDTPPTFIVQAQDDNLVPIENSIVFYEALTKAKVKAEMHVFQSGGHGFGLHNRKETKDYWFDWCKNWMDVNGFLGSK